MLQFVIIAKDGIDAEAIDRRMAARPDHLTGAKNLKASNNFVIGGATLDENGKMIGSVMIVQFETEEEFKTWLATDPYVTGDVWRHIEVKPFKVAAV